MICFHLRCQVLCAFIHSPCGNGSFGVSGTNIRQVAALVFAWKWLDNVSLIETDVISEYILSYITIKPNAYLLCETLL